MITIANFSDRVGEFICQKAEMEAEVKKVSYGVECLLVIVISSLIISTIGWIFGVFKEALLIQIAALIMKNIIGGAHLSGFARCTGFSAILLVGVAILYKYLHLDFIWWVIILLLFLGGLAIYFYAPIVSTELSPEQIRQRKILAIFIFLLVSSVNIFFNSFWIRNILLGLLLSIFLITPTGRWLTEWVENKTKRKGV